MELKDATGFMWFMIIVVILFVIITFVGYKNLNHATTLCVEKGGIMLKSVDGWKCIDVKVIK